MELIPFGSLSHVSSQAMKNLADTIHENERLNRIAERIRFYTVKAFLSQAKLLEVYNK